MVKFMCRQVLTPSLSGVWFTYRQVLLSPGSSLHTDMSFFFQGLVYIKTCPSFFRGLVYIQTCPSFSRVQFTYRHVLLFPGSSLHTDMFFFFQGLVYIRTCPSFSTVQVTYRQVLLSSGSNLLSHALYTSLSLFYLCSCFIFFSSASLLYKI